VDILKLKKNHDSRIRGGHLWVFSNELIEVPQLEPGSVVEVYNYQNESFGYGFYNPNSLIAVRLLKTKNDIDVSFFIERINQALRYRNNLNLDLRLLRLVFGESDFLPGLIIDKYEEYFAVQTSSFGMDINKSLIVEALLKIFPETKGIIEKNNNSARENEGLALNQSVLFGQIPDVIQTVENSIKLSIAIDQGQKTGYFLDQKLNRLYLQNISRGLKVLDCFCNLGGFGLNCARGGAKKITCIDSSASALENAKKNFSINNFNNAEFVEEDVFKFLSDELNDGRLKDIIILDPPAFAKNKKSIHSAKSGYAKLNRLALKLLTNSGFLVSSSCSWHIDEDTFFKIIVKEAEKLNKQLRIVFTGKQSPDHPILVSMPETKYLKFFVFEVTG